MDIKLGKLDTYFQRLRTAGEKVPSQIEEAKPHFARISAASGVSRTFLMSSQGRDRITLAVEELGLDIGHGSPQKRLAEQNAALVCTYLQMLEAKGLKLPESPMRRREVFMTQVEAEVGLTPGTLSEQGSKKDSTPETTLVELIQNAVPRLGLEVRILNHPAISGEGPCTYKLLLDKGTKEREIELTGKPGAKQQLYNTRAALTRFC